MAPATHAPPLPGALQLTFVPGRIAPAGGHLALWGIDDLVAAASRLGLPAGDEGTLATILADDDGVHRSADVPARLVPVLPAARLLATLPARDEWHGWDRPAPSVLAWSAATKLALEVVAGGRMLPVLQAADRPDVGTAQWRAAPPSDGRVAALAAAFPPAAHALRRGDGTAIWTAHALLTAYLDAVADACAREGRRPELDPRRRGPRRPWPEMWASALEGSDPTVEHLRLPADDLADEIAAWASPIVGGDDRGVARLAVRLLPPDTEQTSAGFETPDGTWELEYLLMAAGSSDDTVPAAQVWDRAAGSRVELAGRPVDDAEEVLVRGLASAARLFPPLDRSLSEARPTRAELSSPEVAAFLSEGSQALHDAGIGVQVPPELRQAQAKRLRARVRIGATTDTDEALDAAAFTLSDLTTFRYEIALGDDTIGQEEFAEIVASNQPLVRWRGQWVRIDRDETERLAELAGRTGTLQVTEALAAALSGQRQTDDLGWIETVAAGDVQAMLDRLRGADAPEAARIEGIEGDLRPYQRRGVAWLQRLTDHGMGGVLADEMGLGKTVMGLALLTSRPTDRPHLVVCPTSVVGNWEREVRKFAPGMPVIRHHGPERANTRRALKPGHVVITTYALLRRDVGMLEQVLWDTVVFDEAQQIKNAASKGARAARALDARARIAMTGTPIENRLSELWSIVDVTNPGLLGTQRAFNERYAVPIERWRDEDAAARLRRLIAPFVMRRLKSDPDVALDLPPKQHITVHCSLTREQASLYQAAVDEAFSGKGLGTTTFERRGRILALLTALKQICNHPAQYLKDGGKLPGRSGKLSRATEILGEIVDSGDRALVFTQYRQMGNLLVAHLESALGLPEVPFLHGGVSAGARDAMVERFQEEDEAPPLLVVSLRAGGTGLNLTRATEVLHFDRWWNPAVENQATDRAHRIGQTRPVTVHRLVTAGTVEDRIDELLQRKQALAESVVGEGEAWITELDDDDLHELVSLSRDEVEDEDDAA